ncbi:hypothetical protein GCM10023175_33520 [Pseudonocardia xishanensis]|uniref:Type VII secretion protein EccB n=1 Tax=Pseudonocardia xishanensis TaxID=630995 RepID=A0ABP8RTS1_9PSEU
MRRLEAALVRADPVPLHEQLRAQRRATVVGALLAVLGLVGAALYAVIAPRPTWSAQAVVVGTPSGAVFAVARERLVPVPDVIAARLVRAALGLPAGDPRLVADADLARAPRTAPAAVDGATGVGLRERVPERWGVCDGPLVLAGTAAPPPGPGPALWAQTPAGDRYAVVGGVRHAVTDPAVLAALGLAGRHPVTVASAVLSALPEGPALAVPEQAGGPGPPGVPGRPGDVLVVEGVDGLRRWFAVLPGGVQEVPASLAEVLRARGGAGPREVAPSALAEVPRLDLLPVAGWPETAPEWAAAGPVCALWSAGRWSVAVGDPPVAPGAVAVDGVVLFGGGPVRSVSPTGGGAIWLVSTAGVAYGVADADTAAALGLDPTPPPAPESILRLLPRGGTVDLAQARAAVG